MLKLLWENFDNTRKVSFWNEWLKSSSNNHTWSPHLSYSRVLDDLRLFMIISSVQGKLISEHQHQFTSIYPQFSCEQLGTFSTFQDAFPRTVASREATSSFSTFPCVVADNLPLENSMMTCIGCRTGVQRASSSSFGKNLGRISRTSKGECHGISEFRNPNQWWLEFIFGHPNRHNELMNFSLQQLHLAGSSPREETVIWANGPRVFWENVVF